MNLEKVAVNIILEYIDGDIQDEGTKFLQENIDNLRWFIIAGNSSIPLNFITHNKEKISIHHGMSALPIWFIDENMNLTPKPGYQHEEYFQDEEYYLDEECNDWDQNDKNGNNDRYYKYHVPIWFHELWDRSDIPTWFLEKYVKYIDWTKISEYCSDLEFIEKYLTTKINQIALQRNPIITLEFLDKYNIQYVIGKLVLNKSVSIESLDKYMSTTNSDYIGLKYNIARLPDWFMEKHFKHIPRTTSYISVNKIMRMPGGENGRIIRRRSDITIEHLKNYKVSLDADYIKYCDFASDNPNCTEKISAFSKTLIQDLEDDRFRVNSGYESHVFMFWRCMSTLKLDGLYEYLDKNINDVLKYSYTYEFWRNDFIPMWFVLKHINTSTVNSSCKWLGISANPSIALSFFREHKDKIRWNELSRNRGITNPEKRKTQTKKIMYEYFGH